MNHFKQLLRKPIVQNLLFWTVSFLVLLRMFSRTGEVRTIDVIYTSLFHFPLILGTIFNQFMIRLFLKHRKYLAYWLSFVLSLFLIVQIYFLTYNVLADWVFPDYYFVAVYEWYEMLGIAFIYIILSLLLHFANEWVRQQEAITRISQLEEAKRSAELKLLRGQINPHFLFNSLNTIYGEALRHSDKTPDLVLKLSDILRYAVDSTERTQAELNQELQYIRDYVDLQKERLDHPEWVHLSISGDAGDQKVAPLLFLNIIENCFTHSELSEDQPIHIEVHINPKSLHLTTINYRDTSDNGINHTAGSGLSNTRKRLELLYPDAYQLNIEDDPESAVFKLSLRIKF